jgi:hypothetical protein
MGESVEERSMREEASLRKSVFGPWITRVSIPFFTSEGLESSSFL